MDKTQGKVHSIISNLVLVRTEGPVSQNEICFILMGNERLMAGGHQGRWRYCLCAGI